jgi:stress response protein YsnF
MAVVATDGMLGSVDALQDQLRSAAGTQQDLIVRGSDGLLRVVPPRMVERVIDDTIYLTVPIATVPIIDHPAPTEARRDERESSDHLTIPVAEERLRVTTAEVELGVARVHKAVEEHLAHETVALAFEEIELEHVPIDQVVDHHPAPFMDGDVLVVPLVEEEIVEVIVRRQLRVREELRIRRVTRQRQETIEVPLRREQAEVTEVWHDTPQSPSSPDPLAPTDRDPSTLSGGAPPSTP